MSDNVVVQFGDRVLKGTTDSQIWMENFAIGDDTKSPPIIASDSDGASSISIQGAKAIFFVKSLEGTSHDELRFYDNRFPLPCLWVRVTFLDGEMIEGIIRNDSTFFFKSRFFLAPVDPEGNNWLVLIFKCQLRDFQILGLRQPFSELPEFFK